MSSGLVNSEVQQGSLQALTEVYQQYFPAVWRYVAVHLHLDRSRHYLPADRPMIEDVVSETWLAAVRSIDKFDPARGSVQGWLLGIARNKVNDYWNRNKLRPCEPAAEAADPGQTPEESLQTRETQSLVHRALDRLDDQERIVLEWSYLDGANVQEIAQRVGKSYRAAEALLYRARIAFRAHFEALRTETTEP